MRVCKMTSPCVCHTSRDVMPDVDQSETNLMYETSRTSHVSISQPCLPVVNMGPTRILPYLFLGSQTDALCEESMKYHGINYVLNVSTTSPRPPFIGEGQFLRIPINDTHRDRLLPFFSQAFQFIDKVREANGCVLIHCLAGVSRSATLAIAYVMNQLNMSTDDAYRYVKDKRPTISPNFNFLGQLVEYENELSRARHIAAYNKVNTAVRPTTSSCLRPIISTTATETVVNSPTVAFSKLSFAQLSPLCEASPPSSNHTQSPIELTSKVEEPPSVSQPEEPIGVVIRLGPKHQHAGTKRPSSSPILCLGGMREKSDCSDSKQRRPLARPNSIGVVPVNRPGDFPALAGKLQFPWLPSKCDNTKPTSFNFTTNVSHKKDPCNDVEMKDNDKRNEVEKEEDNNKVFVYNSKDIKDIVKDRCRFIAQSSSSTISQCVTPCVSVNSVIYTKSSHDSASLNMTSDWMTQLHTNDKRPVSSERPIVMSCSKNIASVLDNRATLKVPSVQQTLARKSRSLEDILDSSEDKKEKKCCRSRVLTKTVSQGSAVRRLESPLTFLNGLKRCAYFSADFIHAARVSPMKNSPRTESPSSITSSRELIPVS